MVPCGPGRAASSRPHARNEPRSRAHPRRHLVGTGHRARRAGHRPRPDGAGRRGGPGRGTRPAGSDRAPLGRQHHEPERPCPGHRAGPPPGDRGCRLRGEHDRRQHPPVAGEPGRRRHRRRQTLRHADRRCRGHPVVAGATGRGAERRPRCGARWRRPARPDGRRRPPGSGPGRVGHRPRGPRADLSPLRERVGRPVRT